MKKLFLTLVLALVVTGCIEAKKEVKLLAVGKNKYLKIMPGDLTRKMREKDPEFDKMVSAHFDEYGMQVVNDAEITFVEKEEDGTPFFVEFVKECGEYVVFTSPEELGLGISNHVLYLGGDDVNDLKVSFLPLIPSLADIHRRPSLCSPLPEEEVRQEWVTFLEKGAAEKILLHFVGGPGDLILLFGERFVKAVPSSTGIYNYYFKKGF